MFFQSFFIIDWLIMIIIMINKIWFHGSGGGLTHGLLRATALTAGIVHYSWLLGNMTCHWSTDTADFAIIVDIDDW